MLRRNSFLSGHGRTGRASRWLLSVHCPTPTTLNARCNVASPDRPQILPLPLTFTLQFMPCQPPETASVTGMLMTKAILSPIRYQECSYGRT